VAVAAVELLPAAYPASVRVWWATDIPTALWNVCLQQKDREHHDNANSNPRRLCGYSRYDSNPRPRGNTLYVVSGPLLLQTNGRRLSHPRRTLGIMPPSVSAGGSTRAL
jgi:hypothetical protein